MKTKPIIFVHGLGGRPEDYDTYGVRPYIQKNGDFDPELLRLFHYGDRLVDGKPQYNYQGDIRQIASRFAQQFAYSIERLSADSVAKGGSEKVSIVSYSMGGIISRYYLSCAQPDEHGTVFTHKVDKLIQIGSPNKGVDVIGIYNQVLRGSFLWRIVLWLSDHNILPFKLGQDVRRANRQLRNLGMQTITSIGEGGTYNQPIDPESPGAQQLTPGSDFLRELNQPARTPQDVRYFCLYGDVIVRLSFNLLGIKWKQEFHFGDFAMLADNATDIPGAQPTTKGFEYVYEWALGDPIRDQTLEAETIALPPYTHITLNDKPEVQEQLLRWLES